MALVSQKLDVPLSGGVDEKTRSEIVGPGSLLTARNLRQVKSGSFQKAPGSLAVSSTALAGGALPTASRLLAYKDEALQSDGVHLYTRSGTAAAWPQVAGLMPQCRITNLAVLPLAYTPLGGFNVQACDVAYLNGYYVVAAVLPDGDLIGTAFTGWASVIDASNEVTVQTNAVFMTVTAFTSFTLVTAGTKVIAVYTTSGGTNIYVSWIDVASAATIANGWQIVIPPLVSDASVTPALARRFDACSLGTTEFAIAYINTAVGVSANALSVRTFDSSFVQQASTTLPATVGPDFFAPGSLSISGDLTDTIFVAYALGPSNTANVVGLQPTTLAVTATASTIVTSVSQLSRLTICKTGTGAGVMVAEDVGAGISSTTDAGNYLYTRGFAVSAGAIIVSSRNYVRNSNVAFESRPFVVGSRVYCTMRPFVTVRTKPSADLFVTDLTQTMADRSTGPQSFLAQGYLRQTGQISPRLTYANTYLTKLLPVHAVALSATKAVTVVPVLKGAASQSLDIAILDFADPAVGQSASLQESASLSGAPPSIYDGARVYEIGFCQAPYLENATLTAGGITGTFNYVAVFEQFDGRGQWHQSDVSNIVTVSPANEAVNISVRTLQITNRADVSNAKPGSSGPIRIVLYRTKNLGTVYFRVGAAGVVLNDPFTQCITFPADIASDAGLGAPLYTQPGISGSALVKVTPPSLCPLIAHNDRLVGANGKTIWFSGQSVYGEGYWFADNFQFPVETGGDITALASMDGSLVIFKRNAICYVDGQGPPDNGIGSDFSPPQFIATDVGCIEQRSVVVTPAGIMFQSLRGIELLTRGRQVASYMGRAVEAELAAFPVCTSAVLQEANGRVVFTLVATEGSASGTSIEWDMVHQLWTTRPRVAGVGVRSAVMAGSNAGTVPVYTFLTNAGAVYQETASTYLDAGVFVSGTVETPWIHVGGLNGFQRVRDVLLQFAANTPADITLSLAFDYSASYTQSSTFLAADIASWSFPQFVVQVGQQKCQAIRVKIIDTTPTGASVGTGQGPTLFGLTLTIASKPVTARMPITQGN